MEETAPLLTAEDHLLRLMTEMEQLKIQNDILQASFVQQGEMAKSMQELATAVAGRNQTQITSYNQTINLELKKFSGIDKTYTFDDFSTQLNLYILNNSHLFDEDDKELRFLLAKLEGPALKYVEPFIPLLNKPACPDFMKSYDALCAELKLMYGTHEAQRNYEYELHHHKQTSDLATYVSRFRFLQIHCKWNDSALHFNFYQGLSFEVQREVDRRPATTTLSALITTATACYDFLQQQKVQNQLRNRYQQPRYTPPHRNNNNNNNGFRFGQQRPGYQPEPPQPMDINAIQTQ